MRRAEPFASAPPTSLQSSGAKPRSRRSDPLQPRAPAPAPIGRPRVGDAMSKRVRPTGTGPGPCGRAPDEGRSRSPATRSSSSAGHRRAIGESARGREPAKRSMNLSFGGVHDTDATLLSDAIARGASVLVLVPGGKDPVTARFQRHVGSRIALAMSLGHEPQVGGQYTLFFCAGFQLYWFHTECLSARQVEASSRILMLDMPNELPVAERRRDARIPLPSTLGLTAHLVVSSGLAESVPVLDVSAGGASLAVLRPDFGSIRSGAHGDVTFHAASVTVQLHTRVAQVGEEQCGLEFVRPLSDPLALYALDGIVAAARDYWTRCVTSESA
ncbi:MAG: hypothetical protein B7733_03420 [Myxococcales bacterium FL481]|nr:MAG: hypothetical protein B7733_03420 [Myxococcales bacterium FL481]